MNSLLIAGLIVVALIPIAFAEDELHIKYVETDDPQTVGALSMNMISTAIYSPVQQQAVVTIYVQDAEMFPLGVMMFKTTLLAGETPIEYSFSIPNKCHYDTRIHYPICTADIEKTVFVNVFSDYTFSTPLTAEYEGMY
jgi:hypothetical protein|tara:strand:- start:5768 stop:6184 length:417 start_codon:yes stop_codon:yes gene_type:complete